MTVQKASSGPRASAGKRYTVGELADVAGVSVRTLHHYDEVGLLSPSDRSRAGYRRYAEKDLARLQRILGYRALGFDLTSIRTILDDRKLTELDHLRRQRELLQARADHFQKMVAFVDRTIEARQMGINLDPEEMKEVFGDFDPAEHAAEAEERWGKTDAYKESARRTSKYKKEDWRRMQEEQAQVGARFVAALKSGKPATSVEAMDAAEAARLQIQKWFYDCSHEMHKGLGDMYVADERFMKHYEDQAPGLAQYVRDAIHANAARAGK
jgi:MerR family transcriptional regulator, thiopeptide resistance regulator